MKRLLYLLVLICGTAYGQNVQWTKQNRINPVMLVADSAFRVPLLNFDYAPYANKDSTGRHWYNTGTNKYMGHFAGNTKKAFAIEDSTIRTLDAVLRAGNTTTRNMFFTDTSVIRMDKFSDYGSIQLYTTGDLDNSSNLLFSMGDNGYYQGGTFNKEGFIFRKDTSALGGLPPHKWDSLMIMNDAEVMFNNRIGTLPPLLYLNRLTGFIGLGTKNPNFTLSVMGNQFISGGSLQIASTGTGNVAGGASLIALTSTGNNTNGGITEIQGSYPGVSFNTPIVMQRLGGNVSIGTSTTTEKLNVNGNILAQAPTYSAGGFVYMVRNNTSGRYESISSVAAPTLDAVLIAGNTSTQNIASVQSITTTGTSNFNSNIVVGGTATVGLSMRVGSASLPGSTFQVDGSVQFGTRTITASTTLNTSDCNVFCNNTTAITVTLPSASGIAGRTCTIYKINAATANVLIISLAGNINGGASITITSNFSSFQCTSDGTNWYAR